MKSLRKLQSRALAFTVSLTCLWSCVCVAHAGEVVAPGALADTDGNANNGFPFNIDDFGITSMRFQQVYDAGDFAGATEPILITEIRFRTDAEEGFAFDAILPDVQINLSTTAFAVDQLSMFFDDNPGVDDTIVHSGPLLLSSFSTSAGVRDFDIVIPLSTPFLYDPTQGNLLLDVRNYGGGLTTQFDAHDEDGDGVSRGLTMFGGNVDSLTADEVDTSGLVTQFVYASESKEPASIAVLVDVIPGSSSNQIRLCSNSRYSRCKSSSSTERLPVAILSTEDFDATLTDVDTLLLGDPELTGAVPPLRSWIKDVDRDGDLDLVLEFSAEELVEFSALNEETGELVLTGLSLNGDELFGSDFVSVTDSSGRRSCSRGRGYSSRSCSKSSRYSPPRRSSRGRSCRR